MAIKFISGVSLDSCQRNCMQFHGCIGVDFTDYINTNAEGLSSSCRMYGENIPRKGGGGHNRIYCTTVNGTK